jgi:hypothetical protein
MSILAHRLMRLIELHAEPLAESLAAKIASSGRCATYSRVSGDELKSLVSDIYAHLGQWLVSRTEGARGAGKHLADLWRAGPVADGGPVLRPRRVLCTARA